MYNEFGMSFKDHSNMQTSNLPPNVISRRALLRNTLVRGTGVALALPFLDAMQPAFAKESQTTAPRRMVAIQTNMGILPVISFQKARDTIISPALTLND